MTHERFRDLTFDGFKDLARDETLSPYEKIAFPNSYREGFEAQILADIRRKLPALDQQGSVVVDIGAGCSGLAFMLIELCRQQRHELVLIDSAEMLAHLPDAPFITKSAGYYPRDCATLLDQYAGKVDAVLTYSVVQYVFAEGNIFDFVDRSLGLLAEGGAMLIGDIPNNAKRKRFFSSAQGIRHHQQFTGSDSLPEVVFNTLDGGKIDDAALLALLLRCRTAGFDSYLVPQAADLPMANRREDLLVIRP